MMHLTLKRQEAPGSLEVRWGGEEVWDVELWGGWGGTGNGISSIKNELKIKLNLRKFKYGNTEMVI